MSDPTTIVTLPDGRVLACDDVGDPDGEVVVYLHGAPDCRLARHPDDGVAAAAGIRLVSVDRPGYGASDPQPAPDLAAYGDDLGHLLDHLDVPSCRMLAWSAGALWALAAATVLGERVTGVTTYGAVAPLDAFDDEGVAAASEGRADIAALVRSGAASAAEIAVDMAGLIVPSPPVDLDLARAHVVEGLDAVAVAELTAVDGTIEALARSLAEGVARHGPAALEADLVVQFTPGGAGVLLGARNAVRLVHGTSDRIAGPAVGEWFSARLPVATTEVWEDAGHHALFARWRELLNA